MHVRSYVMKTRTASLLLIMLQKSVTPTSLVVKLEVALRLEPLMQKLEDAQVKVCALYL